MFVTHALIRAATPAAWGPLLVSRPRRLPALARQGAVRA